MEIRLFRETEQEKIKNFICWIVEKEILSVNNQIHCDLDDLKKIYRQPRCALLVAEENSQLIGTVAVKEESEDTALIRRLFVHPAYRRRGYGFVLLHRAIDFCHLNNYKKAVFHASTDMSHAISLCLKYGFREDGQFENIENLKIASLYYEVT
ncbi:MAG: GNAT family N-acetyltransferase [Candidatus Omnitrophota bacterium]